MLKGVCRFYNTTGKCRFGKHCRFSHIEISETQHSQSETCQDGILSELNSTENLVGVEDQVSFISKHTGNDGSLSYQRQTSEGAVSPEANICKFYFKNRFCRYGKRCRYLHPHLPKSGSKWANTVTGPKLQDEGEKEEPEKEEGEEETEKEIKELNDEFNKTIETSKRSSSIDQKKVCRFFKQGYCRYGRRCQFLHLAKKQVISEDSSRGQTTGEPNEFQEPVGNQSTSETGRTVGPSFQQPHIQFYNRDTVSVEKLKELRDVELRQLKRRFPKEKLEVVEEDDALSRYIFTFSPTDPDWPYDVKTFVIAVDFPGAYPFELFKLSLPVEQDLPETVRRFIEVSLQEWKEKKVQEFITKRTVELIFRPFLRWLDRNLQEIVTEGLRQLRRELTAKAAGFEFVSAKQLQKEIESKPPSKPDQSSQHSADSDHSDGIEDSQEKAVPLVVYRKDKTEAEEVYTGPDREQHGVSGSSDSGESDEDDDGEQTKDISKLVSPDTERKGTEMVFRNMQLYYFSASILVERLQLTVQCERCKNKTEFSTPPNRVNSAACGKCNNTQLVAYRAVLAHPYSSTFGYLDLEGCLAFDINLQKSVFLITCMHCNKPSTVKKFSPGKPFETVCRGCHNRIKFGAESVKLTKLGPSIVDTSSFSGSIHKVVVKKLKVPKDPAIQEGKPLPDNGACKHYKKSYRWFRFPCCGKCYPCDVCHDDNEGDHEMKFANRVICGFCCKEQPFAGDKPCVACSSALTKVHSTHWEGGKGCRNKIAMSKSDSQKYSNINKTLSNKAKAKASEKNTKLRHS